MRGRDVKCFKLVKATQKPPSLLLEARLCLCFCFCALCVCMSICFFCWTCLLCLCLCFCALCACMLLLVLLIFCYEWWNAFYFFHLFFLSMCLYMCYVCFCCCAQCECVITIFNWYLLGGFTMFVLSVFVPMSLCSMYQFSGTIASLVSIS